MKWTSRSFRLAIALFVFGILSAQDRSESGEEMIESAMERSATENEPQNEADLLEAFRNDPVDVRHPLYSSLIRLPMVSPMLAESMIMLSDTVEISNVEQFRTASLMTDRLFEMIRPFITIRRKDENSLIQMLMPSHGEMRTRTGYRSSASDENVSIQYLGGPAYVYHRMIIRGDRIDGTLLIEKDPGEVTENGFLSGSLTLKEFGPVERFVVGDFHIASDQGLVFSRANSSSKGANAAMQIRKTGKILSANTSADEVNAFRGAAVQSSSGPFSMILFASRREISASIDSNGTVTSFYSSGLFRDQSELKKKNNVLSTVSGGRVSWTPEGTKSISMTILNLFTDHGFSDEMMTLGNRPNQTAGSIAVDLNMRTFSIFGETATDDLRRFSVSGGVLIPLSRWIAVSYHHRTFAQGYSTPFSHPFGEQSSIAKGESGDYIGMTLDEGRLRLDFFADRAFFPGSRGSFSSQSSESFASAEAVLSNSVTMYGHVKQKRRIGISPDDGNDERLQMNYRMEFRLTVSKGIILTNRLEIVDVHQLPVNKHEEGILMFIDGAYRHSGSGIRFRTRWIFFDAPSYDSRLYQFESGVRGSYSNPPLYGKGIRWYAVAGIEVYHGFICSFKYSASSKLPDPENTGFNFLSVNDRDEQATLQIDFQF